MLTTEVSEALTQPLNVRHHYMMLFVVIMWLIVSGFVGTIWGPAGLVAFNVCHNWGPNRVLSVMWSFFT